jgi:arsenical pump membrane protein
MSAPQSSREKARRIISWSVRETLRVQTFRRGQSTKSMSSLVMGIVGIAGLVGAFAVSAPATRASASQVWPPFVLVTGLLLVGIVADDDGLFKYAGQQLAAFSANGYVLMAGTTILIGTVTAVLNLDTSVAFLTPVLIYAARSRGAGEAPLLYGCLLLSNAGSLFLPGSNLTNLIVLGHLHLTGAQFFSVMWAPALAALLLTAAIIALVQRSDLRRRADDPEEVARPVLGLGLVAVVLATGFILFTRSPAIAVVFVGLVVVGVRIIKGKDSVRHVAEVVGLPLLVGLFGVAVALGTLGRHWVGLSNSLGHLGGWATAGVAAVVSVLVNNLPAASLLAARTPRHPYALLVGLNLGPNLFVTGSLAWMLWFRVAQRAGAQPSLAKASRLGVMTVPVAMAGALAILSAKGLA